MDWIALREQGMGKLKQFRYVLLVLAAGIILMALPSGKVEKPASTPVNVKTQPELQETLAGVLSKIDGAGRVEVLLTQSAGEKTLYQTDDETSAEATRSKTVLISDASREETGLVYQRLPPAYRGAVILCQGADNAQVRLAVTQAVANATGLPSHKISVLKMK